MAPALAQQPARLIDPHDKNAVGPGPGIELGFYDPATGLFTRGMPPASTTGNEPVRNAVIDFIGTFLFGPAGIGSNDTVLFQALIKLGSHGDISPSQLTLNYYAEANTNFAVGKPVSSIPVPLAYTPAGNSPQMSVTVNAQVTDNNNVTHSAGVSLPLEPVPNGNVTRKFRITM
jgi:hypothetical protein